MEGLPVVTQAVDGHFFKMHFQNTVFCSKKFVKPVELISTSGETEFTKI